MPPTRIEVAEGVFKELAECTAADLKNSGRIAREKAELCDKISELAVAIADGMLLRELRGVQADDLLARLLEADPLKASLADLRKVAAELEANALSYFDEGSA